MIFSTDTPYMLFGGSGAGGAQNIDAGLQWNLTSQTFELVFASSGFPIAGYGRQFPCVGSLGPAEYLLVTVGPLVPDPNYAKSDVISRQAPQYYLLAEEFYANGTDTGIGEVEGPFALTNAWSAPCSTCVVKREMTIAQTLGTNENTGEVDGLIDSTTAIGEVRTVLETFLHVEAGFVYFADPIAAKAGFSGNYLGGTPEDNPSDIESTLRLGVFTSSPPIDAGTDVEGIFLSPCSQIYCVVE